MKNSYYTSDGNCAISPKTEELNEIIGDLELSLEVNKSMFKDIITAKKSNKHPSSDESEAHMLISSKSLEIVNQENSRLQDAINRMTNEICHAETLIQISEERAKQSRQRRKDISHKQSLDFKQLKDTVQKKEEEIRRLEKYSSKIEEILSKSLKQESLSPQEVLAEGKKLIEKVSKQLDNAEATLEIEEKKCREAESEIKKIQKSVKIGPPDISKTTDKILKKRYALNLNYENFWFVGYGNIEDVSDSIRSSASSVQDQIFPDKFEFSSKAKPKIPKLNLQSASNSPSKAQKDIPETKLSRLELAYQIKCEETQSLLRILNDLQAIEYNLSKSLEINK